MSTSPPRVNAAVDNGSADVATTTTTTTSSSSPEENDPPELTATAAQVGHGGGVHEIDDDDDNHGNVPGGDETEESALISESGALNGKDAFSKFTRGDHNRGNVCNLDHNKNNITISNNSITTNNFNNVDNFKGFTNSLNMGLSSPNAPSTTATANTTKTASASASASAHATAPAPAPAPAPATTSTSTQLHSEASTAESTPALIPSNLLTTATAATTTTTTQKNFLGGLTWNNKDGIDALDALKEVKTAQSPATGTPSPHQSRPAPPPPPGPAPPPPPPPPLPTFDLAQGPPKQQGGGDMSEVFNQLNQGEKITSGLRHVDKSQMTHKNPSLRTQSTVPERPTSSGGSSSPSRPPNKKPKPESMRAKKPARKVLNGNKWTIENYDNHEGVLEIEATIQQSILISNCNKTIIKVGNKANAITCDNCRDLSIIVDSLISSLEIIKCPKFQLQIDGSVPTLLLEQVDGANIYLNEASLGSEFVSSKCSNINIILPPKEGSDEDGKECPVPEQIRSTIKDGVLVSEVVEHVA
ncbi:hypothetical protein KEM54_001593 [Ascosphaera aggregata]|nr:hypothetical protein KEM54_001593 [Ascosphaera aggregata]